MHQYYALLKNSGISLHTADEKSLSVLCLDFLQQLKIIVRGKVIVQRYVLLHVYILQPAFTEVTVDMFRIVC